MLEPDPPDGADISHPANKDALAIQCQSTEIDCVENVVFVENNNSASQEVVVGDTVYDYGDTSVTVFNDDDAAACVSIPPQENCDESLDVEMKDNEDVYGQHETTTEGPMDSFAEHSYVQPDNREPLSQELQHGQRILKEIMSDTNKSVNWPFVYAVDDTEEGLEDYYERVKQPMWLQKMDEKFESREYKSITEFVADMRLMLENCYRYNGASHQISKKAQRLEIVLEQKLTLLSRTLREKTSIAATSGHAVVEQQITGTRRRVVLPPHDSSLLLNQIRQEEQERQREQRRLHMAERKNQQEAYLQELQSWEDTLLADGRREQMNAMWEIAQIGHFLFLCAMPLNLGEIIHYELERCFLMPRESSTMQRVMTFLISTPYQRTRLENKPAMPYSVWEEKLRGKLRHWYRCLTDHHLDINKAIQKLGLEGKFFQVLGMKNPMERKKYHELTFYQKVWVMKSLCDYCLETQQSIRDAFETQPIDDQHAYVVGYDADGSSYLHFPQFCGADLRIYRQSQIRLPKMERPPLEEEMLSDIKLLKLLSRNQKSPRKRTKKKKPAPLRPPPPPEAATPPSMPRYRDSRLRQNPKTVTTVQPSPGGSSGPESVNSDSDSGISDNDVDSEEPTLRRRSVPTKHQLKIRTPEFIRSGQLTEAILSRSWRRNHDHAESSDGTPTPSRDSTPTPPVWRGHRWKDALTTSRSSSPLASTRGSCVADPDSCASTPAPSVGGDLGSDSCCSMPAGDVAVSSKKKRSRRKVGWNRQRRSKKRLKVVKCDDNVETTSKKCHTNVDIPFDDCTNDQDMADNAKTTGDLCDNSDCQNTDDAQTWPDSDGCLQRDGQTQGKSHNIQQNIASISMENDIRNADETGNVSGKCGGGQVTDDLVNTQQPEASVNTCAAAVNGYISDRSEVMTKAVIKTEIDNNKHAFIESHDERAGHLKNVISCEVKTEIDSDVRNHETATVSESCSEVKLETNNQYNGVLSECDKSSGKVKPETEVTPTEAQLKDDTGNLVGSKPESTLKVEKSNETPKSAEIGKVDEPMESVADINEESDEEMEEVLPDLREFELVVDGVDSLKRLVVQFAELEPYELGTGKKKRLITPPPRKRCVVELHKRLLFLQKELEPWEHKLQQATKRARIKLKKEQETYKEVTEKEKVEDIWESEEEASGEEEEEEEEEDASDAASSVCEPEPLKQDSVSTQVVAPPVEESQVEVEKSSRGRIRKRRLVGDDAKEALAKKRKKLDTGGNNPQHGTPQKTTNAKGSPVPVRLTQFTGAQNSLLNLNLLNKHGVQLRFQGPSSAAGQTTLSAESASLLAQLSGQPANNSGKSPGGTATTTTEILPGQGQQVIKALLSSSAGAPTANTPPKFMPYQFMTVTPTGSQPLNVVTTKGGLTSTQAHAVRSSSGPAIIVLPNASGVRQVSPVKVVKGVKTPAVSVSDGSTPMVAAGPRFFHYNSLSELPPGIIQHILKTQDSRIKGQSKIVPAASVAATDVSTADKNALLLNLIKAGVLPATASLPQCNLSQTHAASDTTPTSAADSAVGVGVETSSDTKEMLANVGYPSKLSPARSPAAAELTKTGQVNPELLARLSGSCEGAALTAVHFSPQRAPKYASNVTVKTLLESRAAATQRGQDGVKDITAALAEVEAKQTEGNVPVSSQYNVTAKPAVPIVMANATQPPKTDGGSSNPPDGATKVVTLPVTVAQQLLQPQLLLSAISQSGVKNPSVGAMPQLCLQVRPSALAAVGHQTPTPGGPLQQLRFQLQAATTSQAPQMAKKVRTPVQGVTPTGVSEAVATKQVLTVLNSGCPEQQAAGQTSGQPGVCAVSVSSGQQPIPVATSVGHPLSGQFWTRAVTSGQPVTSTGNSQYLRTTSDAVQPTVSTGQQQFAPLQASPLTTSLSPVCVVNITSGHQSGSTASAQPSVTTAAQHFGSVSLANILTAVQSPVVGAAKPHASPVAGQQKVTTASPLGVLAPPRAAAPRGAAPQQVMVLPQGVVLTPQLLQQLTNVRGQQPGSLVLQYGKGGTAQLVRAPGPVASPHACVRATAPVTQTIRSTTAPVPSSPVKIRVPVSSSSRTQTHVIRLPTQPPNVHLLRAPGLVAVTNSSVGHTQTHVMTTPTLRAPGLVAVPQPGGVVPGRSVCPNQLAPASGPRVGVALSAQQPRANVSISNSPSLVAARGQKVLASAIVDRSVSNENTLGTSGLVVSHDSAAVVSVPRQVATPSGEQVIHSQQHLLARTSGLTAATSSSTVATTHQHTADTGAAQHTQEGTAIMNTCATVKSNTTPTAQPTHRTYLSHSSVGAQQPFTLTASSGAATVATDRSPRHVYVQQSSPVKTVVPTSGTIVRLIRMQSPVKKGNVTARPHPQQHGVARLSGTGKTQVLQVASAGVQSPTKLVLYNVGGQLVTAQGIPVSLPVGLVPGVTTARVPVAASGVARDGTTVNKPQMLLATGPRSAVVTPSIGLSAKHQQSTVIHLQAASPVVIPRNRPTGSGPLPVPAASRGDGQQSAPVAPHGDQTRGGNSEEPKRLDHVHVSNNRTSKGAVCAAADDADGKEVCVTTGGIVGDATGLPSSGLGLLSQAAALQQAFNTAASTSDGDRSFQTS